MTAVSTVVAAARLNLHNSPGVRAASAVILVAMGVGIGLIGWYGRNHTEALIPRTTDEKHVPHRLAVLRRGSVACMVVGVILVVSALVAASS